MVGVGLETDFPKQKMAHGFEVIFVYTQYWHSIGSQYKLTNILKDANVLLVKWNAA